MKKLIVVLAALGFLVMNSSFSFAEWFAKDQPEKPAVVAAPQAPVVSKKQANKIQEMIAKKKVDLNGTEWMINTKPMSGKGKAEQDLLNFSDGKVSSKNMEAKGFAATNFSMRLLEDNETYTWETMQVSEKDGTAFWRGDIGSDGIMRGVMSVRNKKNVVADYNFVSSETKKISVAIEPVSAETEKVQPVTEAVVVTP
jgi:hypothetical protein